jgi:flagellar biosynthetic protein FliP
VDISVGDGSSPLDHADPGDHGPVDAPSVLLLATSFTKIIVVSGMTRNALGCASPPNQVLTASRSLTLFVMVRCSPHQRRRGPALHGRQG